MATEETLRDYLKWATTNLHDAQKRLREVEEQNHEPLAIVSVGCRFPGGAHDPESTWRLLESGGDAVAGLPTDRGWNLEELRDLGSAADGASRLDQAGFVYGIGEFDAGFFGISPREAVAMDPQQRLLLEVSWEALERAGIDPRSLAGSRTGVFAGAAVSGYGFGPGLTSDLDGHLLTGTASSVISGRVSYTLGLEGPAVTVDTACSSSLVALHLACHALRSGECTLALAGGVTVLAAPTIFTQFSTQLGLASDGRCKAFSADADGMGVAEGVGMVLVERLSDAQRNGHPILALIKGSAINQDGASNGLTAPNGPSQQRVIRAALANARLSAGDVDAVEAHGTGTTLGDPIEAQALLATYGQNRPEDRPLWLGSMKSNIGHAQAAAGIAGVIKMTLALRNEVLPRTLHAEEPSPHIDWSAGNVRLLNEALPWPSNGRPRRAGVSAFGMSGTNVHMILEEAPTAEDAAATGDDTAPADEDTPAEAVETPVVPVLSCAEMTAWPVSGRSAETLVAQAGRLREFVLAHADASPADVGWSLATTRSTFEHRAVVVGEDRGDLSAGLVAVATGQPAGNVVVGAAGSSGPGRSVFVFPGQGSQWAGMGQELLECSPVFAAKLDECAEALAPFVDWSLRDVLAGAEGAPELESADVVQPVLWAVMVSLAAVWEAAGVTPDAVLGHSQGEIAAACVAGILSLEDAARVVALRSRALRVLAGKGGMLSIAEPAANVRERLGRWGDRVSVAAVNGPAATVVSGDPQALRELQESVEAKGLRARMIQVDYASHSAQVDALEDEIREVLAGITPHEARIPMVSAMTGEPVAGPELDAGYWYASLRSPVEFDRAVRALADGGHRTFIEVSPHPVLTGGITDTLEDADTAAPLVAGTLRRDEGGAARLLASLAEVHVNGVRLDWTAILPQRPRIELPTYAFQHQRYWTDADGTTTPLPSGTESGGEAEADFWAAVEGGDVRRLADTLSIDDERLGEILPALSSWRRRERTDSVISSWRYRVSWLPVKDPGPAVLSNTWLLVVPAGSADEEPARECLQALTERGAEVVVAEVGRDDLDRTALAGRIAALVGDSPVAGTLSLLALDETPVAASPVVTVGVAGTLILEQALDDAGVAAPLWAITRGGVSTGPGDAPAVAAQTQVWGLGRVIGLEHPDRWGGLIDLPPSWDDRTASRMCAVLADGAEDQVAIRPSGVTVRRLVRAEPRRANGDQWTPRGSVLITGATGAIGPRLLDWVSGAGAPHVVLPTRTGPGMAGAAKLAAKLAESGTGVSMIACDIAERPQVAGLLARVVADLPPLSTVIHAANLVHLMPLDSTDLAEMDVALGAKAAGAVWLDELTTELGIELDAFVLFSSIAATWGGKEHGAYAAGNAYLDALAEDRRARGLTATAVAWGVWDTRADDEMDMELPEVVRWLRAQGMGFLTPATALAALEQVLADDETFIAVADVDWSLFAPVFSSARSWPLLDELPEVHEPAAALAGDPAVAGAAGELAQRLSEAAPADRDRIVGDLIQANAAAVLGHASPDEVDRDRPFRDLGFDSLTAIELRQRLNAASGLRLSSTVVFDYPSPTILAREMITQLLGTVVEESAPAPATLVDPGEPIAIVGMGCRLPGGVDDPDQLWELLTTGGDAVSEYPTNRGWELTGLFDPDPDNPRTSDVNKGGFLHAAPDFDAEFFGISPREALAMDPQQRLLLEVSWEALERARIDPTSLRGSATGVFVGGAPSGYVGQALSVEGAEGHLVTGNAISVLSGRISYALGLEGPAVTVDTACSSSLVALHLASQALSSGECSLALAGGVMVMADPAGFVGFSRQGALAADGRCKAFSADADGMGMGEGAGMLMLERLSDARRNGHPVLAVVTGSAINQDGASNGLTAPNGPSQQRVIKAALANARLTTNDIDVVEAHGTGTMLGDPIEAQALLATYGQGRPEDRPLWLGSVKSNIGHPQAAAGVAGIIKMVQAMRHGVLPRTLHADVPSPHVDWSAGNLRLLTEEIPWLEGDRPRRAGLSSFGMSGTNAHVIVEDPPPLEVGADADVAQVEPVVPVLSGSVTSAWPVSGRSAEAFAGQAGRLREFALAGPELDPRDVAWSLATTRSTFEYRAVVVGTGREELAAGLSAVATGQSAPNVVSGLVRNTARVGFVFSGQGSQRAGMGAGLYAASPVFAENFDRVCKLLEAKLGLPVADVVLGRTEPDVGADATVYAQTGLFAFQVGVVSLLEAAGVSPEAVAGHSVGEVAAAWAAGVLSLEDAASLVAARARAMQALPEGGGMWAIAAPEAEVVASIESVDGVSIAAVNGPAATVISGDADAVEAVAESWRSGGVRVRRLRVSHAFHSHLMDPVLDELGKVASRLTHGMPRLPWACGTTGEVLEEFGPGYWVEQARGAVRFGDAVSALSRRGVDVFVEIGPDGTLSGLGPAVVADGVFVPVSRPKVPSDIALLEALGRVHVSGGQVDWPAVFAGGRRVELPTYAFQHQRFWPETSRTMAVAGGDGAETAADAGFWAAVEDGDVRQVADTLALDDDRIGDLLPALATWRRRSIEGSAVADWRYRVTWTQVPDPGSAVLSGTWLVATPDGALAQDCVQTLNERGAETMLFEVGADEADRTALAGRLTALDGVAGVVSLLAFGEAPVAGNLALVQALGDAGIAAPLWAVTRGAVSTGSGDAAPDPVQAQVWGFGRVAALEHPERWGGLVDLPGSWDGRSAARFCGILAGTGEDQVAIRATGVMGRRLVRIPPPRTGEAWTPGGTVLVTGGTGGIGGQVALWAAGRGARRVVLTSRSGSGAEGIGALAAELAAAGTSVDVIASDISQRIEVEGLLARIGAGGPPLSSVVHAAGVGEAKAIAEFTPADLERVSAVKVAGATLLDELTQSMDLDAFVVFSSVSAIWGSGLQPGYAAANAFLDALVEARRSRGLVGTSLAWGLWGGAGMGAGTAGEHLQRYGLRLMNPELGIRAMAQAIDAGEPAVTVADVDWARFSPTFTLRRSSPLIEALPEVRQALAAPAEGGASAAGSGSGLAGSLAGLSRAEQDRMLVDLIRAEAASVLGHSSSEAVESERAFSDLGFDSLTAVELRGRLNAATGLSLPATLVFDYPSAVILAEYLLGEMLGVHAGAPVPVVSAVVEGEPIAIVGMSCRLPGGVASPDQLWDLVAAGTDAISAFPQDRGWEVQDPELGDPDASYARVGGFVYDATKFDAGFFGISPREALAMDPQQRLLLEVCWEALEGAGIAPASLRRSVTGVFAGAASSGYDIGLLMSADGERPEGHLATGNAGSVISGRIAYAFGLEGPAVTVDTACSSSMVALHLACQSLRSGECTMALAGGVTVMATPGAFGEFSKQQGMAVDGRCKPFSDDADGTGWAEGAGVLVVERLSDAQRNGHNVLAVIRGSAVNQDGASNGLTAPNGPSQQRVIRAALANARLSSSDVDAVEAHGTGTALGDPIEAQALLATYGRDRTEDRPLWLGSVKSNIGHSQSAAGVAGIIKMVLAMRHGVLPRTLHADVPSRHVDWSAGAVRLLNEALPWPSADRPRRAGVSAFGMSGTNAHVIIEQSPEPEEHNETADAVEPDVPVLSRSDTSAWVVSGRSAGALAEQSGRLREFALTSPELAPADVGWSLATTRAMFEQRAVVVGSGREELVAGMAAVATGQPAAGVTLGVAPDDGAGRLVFVFPGQGSQWLGMGRELAESSPVFAARLNECAAALAPFVDWSLHDALAGELGFEAADVVQPALWAVMVSLAAVWDAAGVVPDAVVGHSQGEIAAACVAGILSLPDAARVVALRSKSLTVLGGKGGMLSVAEPADRVRERLATWGDRVSLAAVNGPSATVVSGDLAALEELAARCEAEDVRARIIPVDYASHSAQVDALEDDILNVLAGITPGPARIAMVSAMTGESLEGPELDAAYWYASLRSTVEFDRAVRVLAGDGHRAFVEVSPHPVLTGAIGDTLDDADVAGPLVTGTLRRDEGGAARLLTSFAEAYVNGVHIDWSNVLEPGTSVDLPTYAFQRQRFWPRMSGGLVRSAEAPAVITGSEAEAGFWTAIENGDLKQLADTLAIDDERLSAVMPALMSWRRRERADSAVADWRYRISWSALDEPGSVVLAGVWLVVVPAGAEKVTRLCVQALADRGAEAVVVEIGPEELDRAVLTARLAAEDTEFVGVLSLLALDESPLADLPVLSGGVAGTLLLVQALGDAEIAAPMWALTQGAVSAAGEAPAGPAQSQVWGMGRVAALEYPDRWGGLIDLPPSWNDRTASRLCAALAGMGEDQVAIRPTGVLGRRLVRAPEPRETRTWTPGGTVLVTGGTGGIGGRVAAWLTERGAQRIVLTSRSGPGAKSVAELAAELATAGSSVDVVACDIASRTDAEGLLERIAAGGPPLSSVVHAAGVGQSTPFAESTTAEQAWVSAVKTDGARWLDELTADLDLDAFVVFSSGAATWGSARQPGYAAANAYLDALTEHRRSRGLASDSVAWGLWGGVGMGVGEVGEQLQRYGLRVMEPDLAIRALAQVIDGAEGLVTVADLDWTRFAPTFTLHRSSPLLAALPEAQRALADAEESSAAPESQTGWEERLSGQSRTEQARLLTDLVRTEAAAVLGYPSADAVQGARAFRDLGVDSVTAVELRNRLSAATGLRLSSTLVFDYPTSAVLAEHLRARIRPDDTEAQPPVFTELDQLETVLSAISADSDLRESVTVRLQTVLSKWMSAEDAPKREAVAGRLDAASADEVLDFIDQQFGKDL